MLVELGVVEQRHAAVLEVLRDGAAVSEVALRFGVARQTVHRWLRRYAQRFGVIRGECLRVQVFAVDVAAVNLQLSLELQ